MAVLLYVTHLFDKNFDSHCNVVDKTDQGCKNRDCTKGNSQPSHGDTNVMDRVAKRDMTTGSSNNTKDDQENEADQCRNQL